MNKGGDLVSIHSQAEQSMVTGLVGSKIIIIPVKLEGYEPVCDLLPLDIIVCKSVFFWR